MQYTPHYNLNLPEGTDIVNPLVQDNPNYNAIDTALYDNKLRTVGTATHVKTGTNHAITLGDSDIVQFKFVATGDYATGDTFTVDGVTVTPRLADGSSIPNGAFKINSTVLCILDGTLLNIINVYPYTTASQCMLSDGITSVESALTNSIVASTNLQAQSTGQIWSTFGSITLNKGKYLAIGCAQHGTIDGICGISIKAGSVGQGNTKASILGSRSFEISSATVTDILDITNDNTTVYFCVWIEGNYTVTPVSFMAIKISQ